MPMRAMAAATRVTDLLRINADDVDHILADVIATVKFHLPELGGAALASVRFEAHYNRTSRRVRKVPNR
jgi:hypothetical protein